MANLIQGSAYILKIKNVPMKCQLDTSIQMSQDMETEDACKDVTGTDEPRWAEDKAGQKSYTVTINGKVEDDDATTEGTLRALVKHFLTSNEPVEFSVGTSSTKLSFIDTYSGTAQITDLSVEFPINGSATYSGTLTGIGKLDDDVAPTIP